MNFLDSYPRLAFLELKRINVKWGKVRDNSVDPRLLQKLDGSIILSNL